MEQMQTEVMDHVGRAPIHANKVVTVVGTPETVTDPSGKILLALIKNNIFGIRKNSIKTVIYYTIDGTDPSDTNGGTVGIGEYIYIPGPFVNIKIDTNIAGAKAEVIVWGDESENPT